MTGKLISIPIKDHHYCSPGWSIVNDRYVIAGPGTIPVGSIWLCDCGQKWEALDALRFGIPQRGQCPAPGSVEWKKKR